MLPKTQLPMAMPAQDEQSHELPSPYHDFRSNASWRIFKIMAEFIDGFEFLSDLKNEVSIFGGVRTKKSNPYYKMAMELGERLGKTGHTVITGGGPGIMEAANHGANKSGADSVGINIQLPREQRVNRYVTKGRAFHYFFTRKVMLTASAQAYVFFPGGFGTMDELLELTTLIQTKKMKQIPIILFGKDHWSGFINWVKKSMLLDGEEYIDKADLNIFTITDSLDEVVKIISQTKERAYLEQESTS